MSPDTPAADAAPAGEVAPASVPPAAGAAERVTVTADTLTWRDGQLRAAGHVRVTFGGESLVAAEATGTAEELTLTDGVWTRADGEVRFARAAVRLRARTGVVTDTRVERGGATLEAASATVDAGGTVLAEGARLEPCACEDGGRPALTFRARRLELLDTEVAVIHGGTVRVFDVPVLPVPYWREVLDPKAFRFLFPEVGYGTPGWSAREHVRFGVGPELVELGPAWRQDRGARAELSLAGPVRLDGALGWDAAESAVRGAVASRGGFAPARRRLAWDLTLQSDADYAADYAPSWVERGVAWHDSRVVAAWGPLRATGWLPDDGSVGDHATARLRPEFGGHEWALAPRVEARVGDPAAPVPARMLVGADGRVSHTWRALHVELAADAATDTATLGAAAVGRAEVPFWAEVAGRPVQFFAGARGELAYGDATWVGVPTQLVPAAGAPAVAAGPDVRASAAFGSFVLQGDGALLVDDTGALLPTATFAAAGEAVAVRAEISPVRQLAQVQTTGRVAVQVGALAAADTALGWADVTLRPGRLLVGGGVSRGFAPDDPLSGAARLGYDDGCSSLVLSAAFSPDRELPDLGLALVLRK